MIFRIYRYLNKILAEDVDTVFYARAEAFDGDIRLTELSNSEYEKELASALHTSGHIFDYFETKSLAELSSAIREKWGLSSLEERSEIAQILRMAATIFGSAPAPAKHAKAPRRVKPSAPKIEPKFVYTPIVEKSQEPSEEEIKESLEYQINELELTLNSSSTDNPLWGCF
ncbi:hypothetical protein [Shewanella glacialipiscicola]|uniref:hypothetical protein n=1 Tax=Shewanella glacialipiscicola TaxID=614069 RepID=UPI003D79A35C